MPECAYEWVQMCLCMCSVYADEPLFLYMPECVSEWGGCVCLCMCGVYVREALCLYMPECGTSGYVCGCLSMWSVIPVYVWVCVWVGWCVYSCVASMIAKRYACICLSVCLSGLVCVSLHVWRLCSWCVMPVYAWVCVWEGWSLYVYACVTSCVYMLECGPERLNAYPDVCARMYMSRFVYVYTWLDMRVCMHAYVLMSVWVNAW